MKLLIPRKTPTAEPAELLTGDPIDQETTDDNVVGQEVVDHEAKKPPVADAVVDRELGGQKPETKPITPPANEEFEPEFDPELFELLLSCSSEGAVGAMYSLVNKTHSIQSFIFSRSDLLGRSFNKDSHTFSILLAGFTR